jgi:hypothetical protein
MNAPEIINKIADLERKRVEINIELEILYGKLNEMKALDEKFTRKTKQRNE